VLGERVRSGSDDSEVCPLAVSGAAACQANSADAGVTMTPLDARVLWRHGTAGLLVTLAGSGPCCPAQDLFQLGVILLRKKLFTQACRNLEKAKKNWGGDPEELAQVGPLGVL
jgi:hypothetical protein